MEKILRIEKAVFKESAKNWCDYEGYQIITDKQTIKLGIDNMRSCCENWGYFFSEDNLDEFIGAELLDIKLTDSQLKPAEFDTNNMYEGGAMFVNIETSKGTLQFIAYNEHNGYYGHESCVISKQLTHEEVL